MIVLFALLFVFIALGLPVFAAIGLASFGYMVVEGVPLLAGALQLYEGLDSFPLLAVPFFILAANLMNESGVSERLFRFAESLVGFLPGGLGHVNISASVIFSGMSGTALADAAGMGTMEIKAMRDAGHDVRFAVGITAASSTVGPLIPPSVPLLIYGVAASASIGQLFLAGVVPGLLVAVALHVMVIWLALRRGYPRGRWLGFRELALRFVTSFPVLLAPVIIIGGIMSGVFTPTEAAVAATVYAMLIGFLVYGTLSLRGFVAQLRSSFETTATTMVILGSATLFGWVLVREGAAREFAEFAISFAQTPEQLLVLIVVAVMIAGLVLDPIVIILVATPIVLPALDAFGIDRVHFGIVIVLAAMFAMMTPPIGMLAFVLARIAGLQVVDAFAAIAPFMVPILVVLIAILFFPELALWFPAQFIVE